MNGPCCVGKRLALSLVEIIRPVYPELLIFSAMIFETCFVITDVRCLLLADLKLGQMVSLVPRLCKNSVFAVSEYYPQSGMQDIPDNDRIRCDLYVGAELGF